MPTKEKIIEVLKTVYDPELNIDVWSLGLIYEIRIDKETVKIRMTFTTPMCPYGPMLVDNIEETVKTKVKGVKKVKTEVVFEPMWQPPEELKAMYGI
jgi:metal-sulfur cluster biosynthetic enzyme